jgi:5'-nucleotidase
MTDCVIGLTHVSIDEDKEISRRVPGLKLIMGGHEHDHMYHQVGTTYIAKADANAKTVYVHRLRFDKNTRQVDIQSTLVPVDSTLAFEPRTDSVVRKWTDIAARSFREMGFDPDQVLMTTTEPLDGRESSIRNGSYQPHPLVTSAVTATAPRSELTIFNSGSIRVDDQLMGPITQYDVLRTLPLRRQTGGGRTDGPPARLGAYHRPQQQGQRRLPPGGPRRVRRNHQTLDAGR